MSTYPFRRVDNGEIVQVDWETMIAAVAQRIILPDGVEAIRVNPKPQQYATRQMNCGANFEVVSDGFGCIEDQKAELEFEAKRHGFTAIEWIRDPLVPGFFQYRATCPEQHRRYQEYREMQDGAEHVGGGQALYPAALAEAERRAKEKYGAAPVA